MRRTTATLIGGCAAALIGCAGPEPLPEPDPRVFEETFDARQSDLRACFRENVARLGGRVDGGPLLPAEDGTTVYEAPPWSGPVRFTVELDPDGEVASVASEPMEEPGANEEGPPTLLITCWQSVLIEPWPRPGRSTTVTREVDFVVELDE